MKIKNISLTLILLFCILLNPLYSQDDIVVLQVNESFPVWSKSLPSGGMGSEIIQAISKEENIKTQIQFVPLKRLIADTTNNDIGNPLFYMPNQEFLQIIPIAVSYNILLSYRNDVNNILENKRKEQLRVGILKGTKSNINLSNKFVHFEESAYNDSLLKKLIANRLDLVLKLDLAGRTIMHNNHNINAKLLDNSASPIAILLDINYPNAKEIALKYKNGLNKIIENGIYKKILQKYYKTDIPGQWFNDLKKFTYIYTIDTEDNY
ncbi:transporter substrate-binding domain-containing protein [Sulfurimonas sp.]|nr:transporter substrate-binding domain-containing protein [Sulfurimonas sp.]